MRNIVLLCHPDAELRRRLGELMDDTFRILEAGDLLLCRRLLNIYKTDLAGVILDFSFLSVAEAEGGASSAAGLVRSGEESLAENIPVIVTVDRNNLTMEDSALGWGADQTIKVPLCISVAKKVIRNTLSMFAKSRELSAIVAEQKKVLTNSGDIMVDALSAIIESRNLEMGQHIQRIRNFTEALLVQVRTACPEYNLDNDAIRRISGAAVLHDIGKIFIPDAIINKPGPLTEEEFKIITTHTTAGSEIIGRLGGMGNEEYLRYAYNICHYHHERWDGSGYPEGLAGDAIPICAQVVGLADAYDALTTKRVYKDSCSSEVAAAMILNGECGAFSPKLLECFKRAEPEFVYLAKTYADSPPIVSERTLEPLAPAGRTAANAMQDIMLKYEVLLQHLNAMVIEFDLDTNFIHNLYNPDPAFQYLRDATNPAHAINMLVEHSVHPDDHGMLTDVFNSYLKMFLDSGLKKSTRSYRMQNKTGVYRYYNITCYRPDENSRRIIGIWEEAPDDSARTDRDPLTDLLNKESAQRLTEEYLAEAIEGRISALAIVDLDNFKNINDRFGHLFGDEVLSQIARRLGQLFRCSDVVARIGGDEFLVFMPNIPDSKLIIERCNLLVDAVQGLFDGRLTETGLSCSVGIAYTPEHGTSYQELFRHADIALYRAKHFGKNRCVVYDTMYQMPVAPSAVSMRIDSDEQPSFTENNLPYHAFDLLYESGDVVATISHLLSIVGQQTNVSRVYIFENNADDTACSNTFEWCNEGITAEIDNLQNIDYTQSIPNYHRNFNEHGVFYCADITTLPPHLRDILEPQGIRSMLQCAIYDNGRFRGYVGLDENTKPRLWTKEQIDVLTFLSRIVSIFLVKHRNQEEMRKTVSNLRKVLNNQYAWVYIVDPETHRIRFFNEQTEHLIPDLTENAVCYRTFMNRDTPCESCLIRHGKSMTIENAHLNKTVTARATPIHWQGKEQWLITCREK